MAFGRALLPLPFLSRSRNRSLQQARHGGFFHQAIDCSHGYGQSAYTDTQLLGSSTSPARDESHLCNEVPLGGKGADSVPNSQNQQENLLSHHLDLGNDVEECLRTLCSQDELSTALDVLSHVHFVLADNTYLSILKSCVKSKCLQKVMQVYAHAARHKYQLTGVLGDYLVMCLAKCGAIADACQLAHCLSDRTAFSWTAIISAYSDCGQGKEALEMYHYMLQDGVEPNNYTFVSLFKACGIILDIKEGRMLHDTACKKGLDSDAFIINTLVSMYGKCKALTDAEFMFGTSVERGMVSWNAILLIYVEHRKGDRALLSYRQMQEEGIKADKYTFVFAIQACGIRAEQEEGTVIEGQSFKVSSLGIAHALHVEAQRADITLDIFLGNALVNTYGKCGAIGKADEVFCTLDQRNVMSWTAMLAAYVEYGQGLEALRLYRQMLEEGISPEKHTLVFGLQASAIVEKGNGALVTDFSVIEILEALHASARQAGFASNTFIATTLVNLYGKYGMIEEARNAFLALPQRDIVSWTAMLSAYSEHGQGEQVLQLYTYFQKEGIRPDQHALAICLQACCMVAEEEEAASVEEQPIKVKSLDIGKALHSDIHSLGYALNVFIGNALVIMYGKCGDLLQAESVFSMMVIRDVVTWTAMLTAYVEHGQGEKALLLYNQIQQERVFLDVQIFLSILQACSDMGSLEACNRVHFDIMCSGYDTNVLVAASSIHAYGNCASMLDVQMVFNNLLQLDVHSCTACVTGYAGRGECIASLHVLEEMILSGIKPNGFTFTSILSACSHSGCITTGLEHFEFMMRDCGTVADLRHYGSLIDLLGRAGDFNKLENLLGKMPLHTDLMTWSCLLGACRIHGNLELGKYAFDHAVDLQPNQAAAYDLLMSIYADAGLQGCV